MLKTQRIIMGAVLFAIVVATAPAAWAANQLFEGSVGRWIGTGTSSMHSYSTLAVATIFEGNTLMTTPNATAAAFTIPSKAIALSFSFSASFPGYPYFKGYAANFQAGGPAFAPNVAPPSPVTFMLPNSTYPYAKLTTATGFLRLKPGGNRFGGRAPLVRDIYYSGLVAATTGLYDFVFDAYYVFGDVSRGPNTSWGTHGWGFGSAVHQSLTTGNGNATSPGLPNQQGSVGRALSAVWITGTATFLASNPYEYSIRIGVDNRTAGGKGSIQLVQPLHSYVYSVLEVPPPEDGTGTITALRAGSGSMNVLTVNMLPEPGQLSLLAAGALVLGGLFVAHRRRN